MPAAKRCADVAPRRVPRTAEPCPGSFAEVLAPLLFERLLLGSQTLFVLARAQTKQCGERPCYLEREKEFIIYCEKCWHAEMQRAVNTGGHSWSAGGDPFICIPAFS